MPSIQIIVFQKEQKNIGGEIIIKEIIKGNLPELKDTNFHIKRAQQVANSQDENRPTPYQITVQN